MPTDKRFDKELLDDAFKALDIFSEQGWDKGFEFLEEAKEKKKRRKEIEESTGTYKKIKEKEYNILKKLWNLPVYLINATLMFLMVSLGITSWILVVSIVILSMIVGVMLIMVRDFVLFSIQPVIDILQRLKKSQT